MPLLDTVLKQMDAARAAQNFLLLDEVAALADSGNQILDPFSVLIGRAVRIGRGNVIYPHVLMAGVDLVIGDGNILRSGTHIEAMTGSIRIGSRNEIGDGGFTARTHGVGAAIHIGDYGRYQGGCAVQADTHLGDGSQVLGAITVHACRLGAGASHRDPDPDTRGGVLKGYGTATGLTVQQGEVIAGAGVFRNEDLKRQKFYHPRAVKA
jgi:NDP-sugar pyrophosphorylase family protein